MTRLPLKPTHNVSTMLVRQASFFSTLPQTLQAEMAQQFKLEEWRKNTAIDSSILLKRFYTLLDGQIELKRTNPDNGREVTLDVIYPGDSFDVVCLLDNKPHHVTIAPLGNIRLMWVPIEIMRKWLWTYPELNRQFLPYLASKIRDQENLSTNLALHDISTRLSRLILKHINRISTYRGDQQQEHKDHLINGLSDEVLARMVGSVRQVVNKQLQHWKSQGIINKKRNEILINDLDALYKEAHFTENSLENP